MLLWYKVPPKLKSKLSKLRQAFKRRALAVISDLYMQASVETRHLQIATYHDLRQSPGSSSSDKAVARSGFRATTLSSACLHDGR